MNQSMGKHAGDTITPLLKLREKDANLTVKLFLPKQQRIIALKTATDTGIFSKS